MKAKIKRCEAGHQRCLTPQERQSHILKIQDPFVSLLSVPKVTLSPMVKKKKKKKKSFIVFSVQSNKTAKKERTHFFLLEQIKSCTQHCLELSYMTTFSHHRG